MRVTLVVRPGQAHQAQWCEAFAAGLVRHGLDVEFAAPGAMVKGDVLVCWGERIRRDLPQDRPCVVLERGYLADRMQWTAAGWGGINGRADFVSENADPERWRRLFRPLMQPWRNGEGERITVMGQVPGDMAIAGQNIRAWYTWALEIGRKAGLPVWFRPHPQASGAEAPRGFDGYDNRPLADTVASSAAVMTFNSSSVADALMAGVAATVSHPGSVAKQVCPYHPLTAMAREPDRDWWGTRMASAQWSIEEMKQGETWEHLKCRAAA